MSSIHGVAYFNPSGGVSLASFRLAKAYTFIIMCNRIENLLYNQIDVSASVFDSLSIRQNITRGVSACACFRERHGLNGKAKLPL